MKYCLDYRFTCPFFRFKDEQNDNFDKDICVQSCFCPLKAEIKRTPVGVYSESDKQIISDIRVNIRTLKNQNLILNYLREIGSRQR